MPRKTTKKTPEKKAEIWVSMRISAKQKARLAVRADVAGLSVSEYMRRCFFGGKPIVAHIDETMIRELRRIGGLLKYNFETLRNADAPENIFESSVKAANEYGLGDDLVAGANIAGFLKVAEAMKAQGVV